MCPKNVEVEEEIICIWHLTTLQIYINHSVSEVKHGVLAFYTFVAFQFPPYNSCSFLDILKKIKVLTTKLEKIQADFLQIEAKSIEKLKIWLN